MDHEIHVQIFAIILADRYGNTMPPILRGPMALVLLAVVAIAIIAFIVNRKKLDEIDESSRSKDDAPKVVGNPWKCPKCGEQLEPQFTTCWKCGAIRDDI